MAILGAVDIGGTKVAVGLVDEAGRVLASRELPTPPLCERGREGVGEVARALGELVKQRGASLAGIGIGSTGPVDPFTGIVGKADTIPGWNGVNLVEEFSRPFAVRVAVENDADACALAESVWGAGRGAARFLYVTVSTGIGGGAVFDGKLYRGAGGSHPEVGHHILEYSGPPCYCGARGCWEMLAAGPAMAAWYAAESGANGITARDVCERAAAGDALALRAVEREAVYLGAGLANLIVLFAPDAIALGGGVMRSWPLLEPRACETVAANCTLVPLENTRIVMATLGPDLPLLGAARVWLHRYA
jgi:glucokinase